MEKCSYADKYKALREPKCGCLTCEVKWLKKKMNDLKDELEDMQDELEQLKAGNKKLLAKLVEVNERTKYVSMSKTMPRR